MKTYDAIGNREDLTDIIAVITRHETPLFSSLQKVAARARTHEWQTDTLATGESNANIEGADFSFAIPAARTRLSNDTQIFVETLEVSETQRTVETAGLDDEFAYQMEKRMKEIATDVEKALIVGTGNSGASGTARELKGILAFITTNVESGTGSAAEALTEDMYNDLLQTIWEEGGRPDFTYLNGFQKRQVSSFATSNTRYLEITGEGELKNTIAVYESDFGRQRIELDSFMDSDKVIALQRDMWAVAQLRPIRVTDVATVGDAKRGALVGELTLEARNEASSGKIIQLSTS
ncbi:MAG: DUF5309 domain-containing protein [Alphaproteobacteria bacterium]|nr:DUF5309 domain-containing protein [Alphaproteobacteria bacterium]